MGRWWAARASGPISPRLRVRRCGPRKRSMERHTTGRVEAVSSSATHTLAKGNLAQIQLLEGLGVEGDAHAGTTVKHRSRVLKNPFQPNLRQVHLIHAE